MKKIFIFLGLILIFTFSCKQNQQTKEINQIIEYVKEDNYQEIIKKFDELIKFKDNNGRNILHYCSLNNSVNTLENLLKHKEFKNIIDQKDKYGNSPLKLAIQKGNKDIVELLLNNGSDINLRDNFLGFTPIMTAAFNNKKEIVKLLYSKGANLYDRDLQYNMSIPFWIVRKNDLEMLKFIIEEMNYKSVDLKELMLEATMTSNIKEEIIEYIYHIEPNSINYQNDENINPLMGCIISGNFKQAQLIISKNKRLSFLKDQNSCNIIDHFFMNHETDGLANFLELLHKNFSKEEINILITESSIYHSLSNEERKRLWNQFLK
ncbi:MAG: ankyrin repeat domain-containing protein [bacterium]|nr:ankyrin repeat domain-containing protein [bacterium]